MDPTKTSGNYTNTVTMTSPFLAPRDLRRVLYGNASPDITGTISMPYA